MVLQFLLFSLASLAFLGTTLAASNSENFYLYSVVGKQGTDLLYSQLQYTKNNQLILISTASDFSSVNESKPFEGSIWQNGYLNEINSGDKVIIVDKSTKALKLGNQPGLGPYSVEYYSLRLGGSPDFLACKSADSNQYYTLHTTDFDCKDKSHIVSLRPNLIDSISALSAYSPSETEDSQFNATSFSTTSSSTSTKVSSTGTQATSTSTSSKTSAKATSASSKASSTSSASSSAASSEASSASSSSNASSSTSKASSTASSEASSTSSKVSSTSSSEASERSSEASATSEASSTASSPESSSASLTKSIPTFYPTSTVTQVSTFYYVLSTLYTLSESKLPGQETSAPTVVLAAGAEPQNFKKHLSLAFTTVFSIFFLSMF